VDGGGIFAPCSVHFIDVIANVALQERIRRLQPRAVLAAMRTLIEWGADGGGSKGGLRGPYGCFGGNNSRQRPAVRRETRADDSGPQGHGSLGNIG